VVAPAPESEKADCCFRLTPPAWGPSWKKWGDCLGRLPAPRRVAAQGRAPFAGSSASSPIMLSRRKGLIVAGRRCSWVIMELAFIRPYSWRSATEHLGRLWHSQATIADHGRLWLTFLSADLGGSGGWGMDIVGPREGSRPPGHACMRVQHLFPLSLPEDLLGSNGPGSRYHAATQQGADHLRPRSAH
jgi:hypothetical protein